MSKNITEIALAFDKWWEAEGRLLGLAREKEVQDLMHRIGRIAWLNGAVAGHNQASETAKVILQETFKT